MEKNEIVANYAANPLPIKACSFLFFSKHGHFSRQYKNRLHQKSGCFAAVGGG